MYISLNKQSSYLPTILFLLLALTGCKGSEIPDPIKTYQVEDCQIITLSTNSPTLIADGVSRLSVTADFYYQTPQTGDKLFRLPKDRIDLSKVRISASDGKTFTAAEAYSTTDPDLREVTLTASYGKLTSAPITVELHRPDPVVAERREIPVTIILMSSPVTAQYTEGMTDDYLGEVISEVNRIFDGTVGRSLPTHSDLGVHYDLKEIRHESITREQEFEQRGRKNFLDQYCRQRGLYRTAEETLYIVVTQFSFFTDGVSLPRYTYGDPSLLPGIKGLRQIATSEEMKGISPSDICINPSYSDIHGEGGAKRAGHVLASQMARFYGLLLPRVDPREVDLTTSIDADECPDTYNVNMIYNGTERETIPDAEGQVHYYRPFHVMEGTGPLSSITQDQAKRIRTAMRDVPYRRQGRISGSTAAPNSNSETGGRLY